MNSIADTLQQMLLQRAAQGQGLINNYQSTLGTAATQDQQSIDQLRGIYNNPANFEKSKLGAFGLGLMAPTQNGRFSEGMFNALAAATAAQDYNREQNLSREEKLAKLTALEAQLTRQKAQDSLGVYNAQTTMMGNMQNDQSTLADLQLGNGPGSRPLAPGEQGPEAADQSPIGHAMLVYQDYTANPQKYAGPQGQAMVRQAVSIINNERNNQTRLQTAEIRSQPKPFNITTKDKTLIDEAKRQNVDLKNTITNLEEAETLGPKTWSGPMANERARVTSWWYGNEGQDNTTADEQLRYQQIMEGEAIKQMSETLKGATTDREMQKFIDIVADPSVPWNSTKKRALAQVKRFAQSLIDLNDEKISGIRDGSYYTGQPSQQTPDLGEDDLSQLPDGVVIQDDSGQQFIIQGGQKVPYGGQ